MRRMQTIEKVIGENTFYIRPFGAFAAANISGELAALLSPILAGIAPLFGGLTRETAALTPQRTRWTWTSRRLCLPSAAHSLRFLVTRSNA